jgi:hypothetical protein
MLNILRGTNRGCRGLPRRRFMQIGLLGPLAFGLPQLQKGRAVGQAAGDGFGRAKRCLMVFLNGGPSQLDLWDMKPNAPAEVRGELRPIDTCVPGIRVSELLPRMAREADKFPIWRSTTSRAGRIRHRVAKCS